MAADNINDSELELGYIAGAHGVGGAVKIHLHHRESKTLQKGTPVFLKTREGKLVSEHTITKIVPHPGTNRLRVWLSDMDGRDKADSIRGLQVWISREHLPDLNEDEFYLSDLIGLRVFQVVLDEEQVQDEQQRALGQVSGVGTNGAQDLLEIEWNGRGGPIEWLLPVLPQFVVSYDDEQIFVVLPDCFLPDELESLAFEACEAPTNTPT